METLNEDQEQLIQLANLLRRQNVCLEDDEYSFSEMDYKRFYEILGLLKALIPSLGQNLNRITLLSEDVGFVDEALEAELGKLLKLTVSWYKDADEEIFPLVESLYRILLSINRPSALFHLMKAAGDYASFSSYTYDFDVIYEMSLHPAFECLFERRGEINDLLASSVENQD